ncbi:MAG: DNA-binding response regulator [Herminiimonas sp.]|nr:DNA-binding response regulator [Herminiimonas sp.]
MIRVLLVDDHVLVRVGLHSLLNTIHDVEVVAEAGNGVEALAQVEALRPDLVLMDVAMNVMNGIEATTEIKRRYPAVQVLILSMYLNEAYVDQALRAGASGYLLKDTETSEMARALYAVASGEIYLGPRVSRQLVESFLKRAAVHAEPAMAETAKRIDLTARQREILKDIAEGWSTKEIAHRLGISPKTVEAHRAHLMERLDIRDIPGLVRYAIRNGLASLD